MSTTDNDSVLITVYLRLPEISQTYMYFISKSLQETIRHCIGRLLASFVVGVRTLKELRLLCTNCNFAVKVTKHDLQNMM